MGTKTAELRIRISKRKYGWGIKDDEGGISSPSGEDSGAFYRRRNTDSLSFRLPEILSDQIVDYGYSWIEHCRHRQPKRLSHLHMLSMQASILSEGARTLHPGPGTIRAVYNIKPRAGNDLR
jgi:hypothetical protein